MSRDLVSLAARLRVLEATFDAHTVPDQQSLDSMLSEMLQHMQARTLVRHQFAFLEALQHSYL